MNRSEITKRLSELTEKYINPNKDPRVYWAREVTFDYGTEHQIRVDYMKFKPMNNTVSGIEKGAFYCFEVKSCIEDFRSKNGHNFIGDFNYYVMTEETYQKIKDSQRHPIPLVVDDYTIELFDKEKPIHIPWHVGVLVPGGDSLKVVKKAHREDRNRPVYEMLLMMFRSANRDRRITNDTR